jgi:glutamine synthetase
MSLRHSTPKCAQGAGVLEADHEFLLAGDVFTRDQIESCIQPKWTEVYRFEHTPHPVEFEMYCSV